MQSETMYEDQMFTAQQEKSPEPLDPRSGSPMKHNPQILELPLQQE